jgi:hypothetical protein
MEFSVDAAALAGLPAMLDRLGDDAQQSRNYLNKHTDLNGGEGFFNVILGGHRQAVDNVNRFFTTLAEPVAGGNATRVRAAVDFYKRTDHAAAAAFDATLPSPGAAAPIPEYPGARPAVFADRAEPTGSLASPPDYNSAYPYHPKWTDLVSPASAARDAIWFVTDVGTKLGLCDRPFDPFLEYVRPWTGDWAGLRACADVFDRLAAATTHMAGNVSWGAQCAQSVWTGNAADGCVAILGQLTSALTLADEPLRDLAAEYRKTAEETHRIADTVAALIAEAADLAIIAALEAAAALATSETIVGPVLLGSALAFTIWHLVKALHEAVVLTRTAAHLAELAQGALAQFTIITPGAELPALPTGAPALPK